ncbi:hypothetical protein MHYP_G00014870 [Metynnis hypsauchen]
MIWFLPNFSQWNITCGAWMSSQTVTVNQQQEGDTGTERTASPAVTGSSPHWSIRAQHHLFINHWHLFVWSSTIALFLWRFSTSSRGFSS